MLVNILQEKNEMVASQLFSSKCRRQSTLVKARLYNRITEPDGSKVTRKVPLATCVRGQDGAYLAELLLAEDCEVHCIERRLSPLYTSQILGAYRALTQIRPNWSAPTAIRPLRRALHSSYTGISSTIEMRRTRSRRPSIKETVSLRVPKPMLTEIGAR